MGATIQDGGSRERKDFVDDILIYSNNMSAYHQHVKEVFKYLCKTGFFAKA